MSEVFSALPNTAELLRRQFYQWELRGRGWDVWGRPVDLEPPFRAFEGHFLPPNLFHDDGLQETLLSRMINTMLGGRTTQPPVIAGQAGEDEELSPEFLTEPAQCVELQAALPRDLQPSREVFEQCLFSLNYCHSQLGFEVVGPNEGFMP